MVFSIYSKTESKGRALILAFSCDPHQSMEERNGWNRALQAASNYQTVVLCGPHCDQSILEKSIPEDLKGRIQFIIVPLAPKILKQIDREISFYRGYRKWTVEAKRLAVRLHEKEPFDFAHLATLCGFREPGTFYELPMPFILGPIGGTSGFPLSYLRYGNLVGGLFEVSRNIINYFQRNHSRRISNALANSAVVLAANSSTQKHLSKFVPNSMPVMLETGIDYELSPPRDLRDPSRPLRILWTGRLRMWKGLPLLLYAMSKLPPDVRVNLRVLGEGRCSESWKRLAGKLKLDDCIEWLDRPSYRESMEHYHWADVFAFTSLRDTSGTGLLESLAAGVPIIGLDHQGAADMITDNCGIKISVGSPKKSIDEFTRALIRLSRDATELHRLSLGATERAKNYQWTEYSNPMLRIYNSCIQSQSSIIRDRATSSDPSRVTAVPKQHEQHEGAL
ncbi:MAG: glycosyltransferase [Pirellula sp.]|nr:glycosyltransferase [Pirellula sp.]